MKTTICLLLLAFSFASSAQKIRFTDHRNHWITQWLAYDGTDTHMGGSYYRCGRDTTMFSKVYASIVDSQVGYNPTTEIVQWVREDTIANKVFYIGSDSVDHVLYNYNLQAGDSIVYGTSNVDSVVAVDSVLINGIHHKVFTMSVKGNTIVRYTIIEGIGCTNNFRMPITLNWFTGAFSEWLLWFSQDADLPNFSALYFPLNYYAESDTFVNGAKNCNPLAVKEISKAKPFVTLFPNPTTSTLTITSNNTITSLEITNLTGQKLFTHNYNTTRAEVDVSAFPSGLYYIRINGVEVRKFVIE